MNFNEPNIDKRPPLSPPYISWTCTVGHGSDRSTSSLLPWPDRPSAFVTQGTLSETAELVVDRDPWPIAATVIGLLNTTLIVWLVLR